MKSLFTLIFLLVIINEVILPQNFISNELYNSYASYKDEDIKSKRFIHSELLTKIKKLKQNTLFNIELAGKSLQGKEIYLVSVGEGKTNVLLWSQMHGDESTATMALLDIFNFFAADDELNKFRKQLLKKLKIFFIPMLNPDGAEVFQRRNALDIDINRDALRLQFPESKILKSTRDKIEPQFAFNLHDQSTRYTSGNSYNSATISFLAPAYNYEKEVNRVRGNTMKLIVNLYEELSKFIPGHIAKYDDAFEPRAFGDNFIKWGTSSVLIESGGWKNDEEKQFIRKLNYISILTGLNSIANKLYRKADIKVYDSIPFNDKLLFDLLLRNLTIKFKNRKFKIDIGVNREELATKDRTQVYYSSKIEDMGDLSIFYGYDELNLEGYELRKSKIFKTSVHMLNEINYSKLLKDGVGFIKLDASSLKREFSSMPFNILLNNADVEMEPKTDGLANFTIWKNGKVHYNVINGFIYDVKTDSDDFYNGLIFK